MQGAPKFEYADVGDTSIDEPILDLEREDYSGGTDLDQGKIATWSSIVSVDNTIHEDDTEITLAKTVTGWKAGDIIAIPDTRMGAQAGQWQTAEIESVEDIRRHLEGAQLVFLCAGLGGGTGSGAARIIASSVVGGNRNVVSARLVHAAKSCIC